jgi:PAS domain S-box-containing protein
MLSNFSAFNLLADAYLVLDHALCIVTVNDQYCRLTRQTASDVVGRNIFDVNQHHANESARRHRRDVLESLFASLKSVDSVETPPLLYPIPSHTDETSDRYWKLFAHKKTVSTSSQQASVCYVIRLQDVTAVYLQDIESRKAQALLRSKAQLRKQLVLDAQRQAEKDARTLNEALSFARIGAWTLDLTTGVIDCTPQCKANFGQSIDYLMTHDNLMNELVADVDRARLQDILEKAVHERSGFETEYRTRWPSGEMHWIMVRGKFAEDDDGTFSRMSGFTMDITDRKLGELDNEAKVQVEVDARRASEARVDAIDTFVSAISHELRSPLHAIGSWVQLLDRPEQISLPKAADVIKRNVRQLSLMVEDLLDTGAIINGKMQVALKPVDFVAIANSVVEDARLNVAAKDLSLHNHLTGNGLILGDDARLRQVCYNLLTNAVKFTEKGSITASVDITTDALVFTLTDTGIGISESMQKKIFERFNQASQRDVPRGAGLGLGLWLASTIVKAHDGTISVESAGLGYGTAFSVSFPKIPS